MPTPARRAISAIEISASGSANASRATARIFVRLRSASARFGIRRGYPRAFVHLVHLPLTPPIAPMLAKPAKEIPPGQFYEPKWDGFRAIVFRDGDEVVIGSRKERPLTRYFPEVVEAV